MSKFCVHIDADAFFASVEQCLHPELKGKPVVTGREGSMVVAMSYEAKKLGIERGIPTYMVHRDYPGVYMVASDYQMYRIFSSRMIAIVNRYFLGVEKVSVDECRALFPAHVGSIDEAVIFARKVQKELEEKLGCSFSFGISSVPLIAKIASGMEKPSGCTVVTKEDNYEALRSLSISKVPGFGRKTVPRLQGMGIGTIGHFLDRYDHIRNNFSIVVDDIYHALCGEKVRERVRKPVQSINRARSFKVTNNRDELLGQLMRNFEYLTRKMRSESLSTSHVYVTARDAERKSVTVHTRLPSLVSSYEVLSRETVKIFENMYQPGVSYRYISLTFSGLESSEHEQPDLFGASVVQAKEDTMWHMIDSVNEHFGKNYVTTANTLKVPKDLGSHLVEGTDFLVGRHTLLPGENLWKRLVYPYLGKVS